MAIANNNPTLAIVLVIGLTIAQLGSAALTPKQVAQIKDPKLNPDTPLSDILEGKVKSPANPSNNPVPPQANNAVTPPVNNAGNNPVPPQTNNAVTPPVNNAVNQGSNLPNILKDDLEAFLAPQNAARAKVGVQPFVWNESLAEFARSYAQERANDCYLQHSHAPEKGENIARSPGDLSPLKAVEMWLSEEANYNAEANICKSVCGHYTQVVWKASTSVGCARSDCHQGQKKGTFVTCNYYPPGNVIGRRPY